MCEMQRGTMSSIGSWQCCQIAAPSILIMVFTFFFIDLKMWVGQKIVPSIIYLLLVIIFRLWNFNNHFFCSFSSWCLRGRRWWAEMGEGCQRIKKKKSQQGAIPTRHGGPTQGSQPLTGWFSLITSSLCFFIIYLGRRYNKKPLPASSLYLRISLFENYHNISIEIKEIFSWYCSSKWPSF